MSNVVHIASVCTIVPAIPTRQPCTLWLCNSQIQLLSENYLKQVYYFPEAVDSSPGSFDRLVTSLKVSLSQVLVPYYPIAGRPRIAGLDRPVLECNNQGVEFVVAFANASFHDWGDSMKHCSIEHELNQAQTEITDHENFPQLKVTKFRCGGIALGLVTTHIVTDGSSIFAFFKAWSDIHQGLPPPNPPPSFDSSILRARDPPSIKMPIRDYVAVAPSLAQDHTGKSGEDISPKYHVREFHMSELQLSHLRHEIASGPFSYGSFPTSFEAAAALVWKSITEARDLVDTAIATFVYSGSAKAGKNRRHPPIPDEYCGTSAMTLVLPCPARDLKNKHISLAARLVHDDIRAITHERFQSTIDWMELEGIGGPGRKEIAVNMRAEMAVYSVDLVTFPVYDVDFGWGRPAHFSLVLEPWYGNGVVVFLPTAQGGTRERRIVVMLLEDEMKRLLRSELLAKFATLE
ncbi:BAHD family acyltransferase [Selaginella moellendorffii]|uniref:BAHD family acyltransferase n=1 Tax=Selaginella moellendorffii TaxID=88036 RepID=D8TC42_SELML|nr:BAHD family acyltransferase [Selaginella moellendorffii]